MSETTRVPSFDTGSIWPFTATFQRYGVTVIAGVLIAECALFLTIPPASEYETSLVNALPVSFWLCFYTVLAGGIVMMVASATTGSGYWRHGLALVLANYALFFFLPHARGYRFYGQGSADALVHVGDVKVILGTGSLPGNWYPAQHILMSELTMLGIPLDSITYVTAFLFTALHILGIGVLVGNLTEHSRGLVTGLAAGTPLIFSTFHLSNHPAVNSFMLVPVFFLIVERYRRTSATGYLFLFVLLSLMFVYFHPMTTLFVVAILFAIVVYTYAHGVLTGEVIRTLSPRLAIVPLPLLFAWLTDHTQTRNKVRALLFRDRPAPAVAEVQEATTVDFTPAQLLGKFVSLYGAQFLYLLVAGLFAMLVLRELIRGSTRFEWGLMTTQFGLGTGIAGVFLFRSLIVSGRIRIGRVAILFAAILVGLLLLHCIRRRNVSLTVALTVIILLVAGLGANAAYEPNQHMTHAEFDGTQFLVANYELGTEIYAVGTRDVVENYVLGSNHPQVSPSGFDIENSIPRELGYDSEGTTAADTFGQGYVVTKTHDIKQHTAEYFTESQRQLQYRYDRTHLDRLHRDRTANKIYTNGGFTGWLITPPDGDDTS